MVVVGGTISRSTESREVGIEPRHLVARELSLELLADLVLTKAADGERDDFANAGAEPRRELRDFLMGRGVDADAAPRD